MKNLYLIRAAAGHSKPQRWVIGRKFFRPFLFRIYFLLLAFLLLLQVRSVSQTINFITTPETTVPELTNYLYTIEAGAGSEDGVVFSAAGLPSWLTLGTSTPAPLAINATPLTDISGVAVDENGNYYFSDYTTTGKIYRTDKNGNTSVFATKPVNLSVSSLVIVDSFLYAAHGPFPGAITKYDLSLENQTGVTIYNGTPLTDLVYRSGALYAPSVNGRRIIKTDLETNITTDVVALPIGVGPTAITFETNGDMLFTAFNGRLYRYSFASSTYAEIASGLPTDCWDLQFDATGNLLVASLTSQIRKYDASYTSYALMPWSPTRVRDICFTSQGTLVYDSDNDGHIFKLASRALLTGTPTHADVGSYPVAITATKGATTEEQQFTITVTDPNAPLLTSNSPINGDTEVPGNEPLVLSFNEAVKPGTGVIEFRRVPDGFPLASIDVSDAPNAVFNNSTVTISHFYLPNATGVYIYVPAGAILDMSNNPFAGFNNNTLTYTTFDCSASLSAAGNKTIVCTESPIILSASAGVEYNWTKNRILIAETTGATFSATEAGDYRAMVVDNRGCRDSTNIVKLDPSAADASITGPAVLPCEGTITLTTTPGLTSYQWYFNGQETGSTNNSLTANQPGKYKVSVTDTNGCSATTSSDLEVTIDQNADCDGDGISNGIECPGGINCADNNNNGTPDYLEKYSGQAIIMPTLFSPNGDGINDVITPVTPGLKAFTVLRIYNRWGNLVFESRDRDKSWDGRLNGKAQPADSYVWVCTGVDYNNKTFSRKGILTLIR